ncbi:MAG: hypothetical protein WCJ09_21740 [Planctomycetota bacterium]
MSSIRKEPFLILCLFLALIANTTPGFQQFLHAQQNPAFNGCSGPNNAVGPCKGSNSWSAGTGNGCPTLYCCCSMSNITKNFTPSSCIGTYSLPSGVFDCNSCGNWATQETQIFNSEALGTFSAIACIGVVAGISFGTWTIYCIIACCGVTLGAGCLTGVCVAGCVGSTAALTIAGIISSIGLACLWIYCQYSCSYTATSYTGSCTACNGATP